MSSIFLALNTANSALEADQAAIETIDHNVSNANTAGYSQQTAHLVASPAYTVPSMIRATGPGQMGTGVTVQGITRARDGLLDGQFRYQNQLAGQWSTLDTQYTQIQGILKEPSTTGLNSQLTAFWNSWQSVADDPTNTGARAGLQQTAIQLTTTFNNDAQQLTESQQTADGAITNAVNTINNMTTQIANLNGQIRAVIATGQQPNDLMDQRDVLIDQLSTAVPITYAAQPDGTITINLATQVPGATTLSIASPTEAPLVLATATNALVYATTGGTPTYTAPTYADGKPLVDPAVLPNQPLIGGQLGAALQLRNLIIGSAPIAPTPLKNAGSEAMSLPTGIYTGGVGVSYLVKVASVSGTSITGVTFSTNGGTTWTAGGAPTGTPPTLALNNGITTTFGSGIPQVGDQFTFTTGAGGTDPATYAIGGPNVGNETATLSGAYTGATTTPFIFKAATLDAFNNVTGIQFSANNGATWTPLTATNVPGAAGVATTFTLGNGLTLTWNQSSVNAATVASAGDQLVASPGNAGLMAQLNNLVKQVVQDVNTLHDSASAYDANGNNNLPFFNITGGASSTAPAISSVTAANVVVNAAIVANPAAIAASGTAGAAGDGTVAQAIANLRSLAGAVGTSMPGVTIQQGYENMISTLGANAQQAHNANQAQSTVMNSLSSQRLSLSGVSLDEQMTMLVQFQHSYSAAARVVTTIDSMLDTIVNHLGLGN